ncbi:MAG TPA: HK97 gp10 family phage protein [Vicinamibacterales bacterium]|nr:HK97 gp10 family phage protein [Vicinamibacterales bacterium]
MAPLLTIDVDNAELYAAFDALGAELDAFLKPVALDTAQAIQREARARVRRATGATANKITIEPTRDGTGYVVFVNQPENPGLAGWIEFGTVKMTARGFLFTSARLEEGGHLRRVAAAIQEALDVVGLGVS